MSILSYRQGISVMTKRVTRKAFKNGGSWAVRIPKGWLPEDAELDMTVRDDGVLEIRPLDRDERMKALLARLAEGPEIPESEFPVPDRSGWVERFNFEELFKDEEKH